MFKFRMIMMLVLATALLTGCSTVYYGHTEEQWNEMTKEERDAAKAEYEEIIDSQEDLKRQQVHDERTQSIIDRGSKGEYY